MGWIALVQDRDRWWALMNMAKELRVPYKAGNVLTSQVTVRFSRRTVHRALNLYANQFVTYQNI
jgi:hypothetical protein